MYKIINNIITEMSEFYKRVISSLERKIFMPHSLN